MITIKNLTKQYDNTVILQQANYSFPLKGMVSLMGPSGSGKTTLFNLLAGFDTQYEGDIIVANTALTHLNNQELCAYRRDNIGFVFQNYHLLAGYTVLENVIMACELTQANKALSHQKAKVLLKQLGLSEKESQRVETLSGGQKQRVAIARALIGNPQIIFADEPTGALDRHTSNEIMTLLKEISKTTLVLLITHDPKVSAYADEVIYIKERQIVSEKSSNDLNEKPIVPLQKNETIKPNYVQHGIKNFKVHLKRYLAVSLAISIGILSFLFSLSFKNVMDESILAFQQKNTAFNSGFILNNADVDDAIFSTLSQDARIETAYYQYKINDIQLIFEDNAVDMSEKYPGSKATENMSYGTMPRLNEHEIALSPSLAKKFDPNISSLIGKQITLSYGSNIYQLTISGIFNAGYDDFFVSRDLEQQFYKGINEKDPYSFSYEVKHFSDINDINNELIAQGINPQTAAKEVSALEKTFDSLNRLFLVISILILLIALFISTLLLVKLQNSRYHEVGLLSALGYNQRHIFSIIVIENTLLSTLAIIINLVLLMISILISNLMNMPFSISEIQIILTIIATFIIVTVLSALASYKLLHTEPSIALRK